MIKNNGIAWWVADKPARYQQRNVEPISVVNRLLPITTRREVA